MGATKSRMVFKRKHVSIRKSVQSEQEAAAPKIVLFTGHSHRMNLAIALPLAEDPLSSFKVLVTIPSLSSSEYLEDPRVLNVLNKTLFVLPMDFESEESIKGVLREIMDNDGFIDAVGECIWCLLVVNRAYFSYFDYATICIVRRTCESLLSFLHVIPLSMVCESLHIFLCAMRRPYVTI